MNMKPSTESPASPIPVGFNDPKDAEREHAKGFANPQQSFLPLLVSTNRSKATPHERAGSPTKAVIHPPTIPPPSNTSLTERGWTSGRTRRVERIGNRLGVAPRRS